MLDVVYLGIAVAFFAVSALYIFALRRLQPEADDE